MFAFGYCRETPKYHVIYNKINDYQTMTRGEVEADLKANHYWKKTPFEGDNASDIAATALYLSLAPVLIGIAMGLGFTIAGGFDWAKITWIASGGVVVAMFAVSGCARIVSHHYRNKPPSEKEWKALKEEIAQTKAEDIKSLHTWAEIREKEFKGNQDKAKDLEKLNFQTS